MLNCRDNSLITRQSLSVSEAGVRKTNFLGVQLELNNREHTKQPFVSLYGSTSIKDPKSDSSRLLPIPASAEQQRDAHELERTKSDGVAGAVYQARTKGPTVARHMLKAVGKLPHSPLRNEETRSLKRGRRRGRAEKES